MKKLFTASLFAAAAAAALLPGSVSAADKVSGDVGVSYNTHFISYGADVWGGGNDFYGDRSTTFVYGDLVIAPTEASTIFLNVWTDNNDNTTSEIGGHLQEVDLNVGGTYKIGPVTAGLAYGSWNYAGDAEEIIDVSLAFDDTGLISPGFALSPKLTWHNRVSGNGGQETGSALTLGVGPSFMLTDTVSLSIPAGVAFFLDDGFQGGDDGYAYSWLGASVGVPLSFISEDFGAWSVSFDLVGYFTDEDAIPGNKEENFLTSSIGLKVAF